jgi:hypothetical protein
MHSEGGVSGPKRATSLCDEQGPFPSLIIPMMIQTRIIDRTDSAGETLFVARKLAG